MSPRRRKHHQIDAAALDAPLLALLATCVVSSLAIGSERRKQHRIEPAGLDAAGPSVTIFEGLAGDSEAPVPDEGKYTVELTRFVTAYGADLEVLVDITPYSPILQALAQGGGDLVFYTFVDTWVGNGSDTQSFYLNNVTRECSKFTHSYGHGWSVDVDLVLLPQAAVDTRPRETVVLASGYCGSHHKFGRLALHEGLLAEDGKSVSLPEDTNFDNEERVCIYRSKKGNDVKRQVLLNLVAQAAHDLSRQQSVAAADGLVNDTLPDVVFPDLVPVNVTGHDGDGFLLGRYNPTGVSPVAGMPVYYLPSDVSTDMELAPGRWFNQSYPFLPVGHIDTVVEASQTFTVKGHMPCAPTEDNYNFPRLLMPRDSNIVPAALSDLQAAVKRGVEAEDVRDIEDMPPCVSTVSLGDERAPDPVQQVLQLLRVVIGRSSGSGSSVWLVGFQRQNPLFRRDFGLSALGDGERAVLQLTVTGHGWAQTLEQCGEYCHAVYILSFNGVNAINVTQWRDDCVDNPIDSKVQKGTWDESRNGWCPGSAEPGLFVDVTQWLHAGPNDIAFDVVVWSSKRDRYEPYTDTAGFASGDRAQLTVGLSVFVYAAEAVTAVLDQARAYTAAEAAIRMGSSNPASLAPPAVPEPPAVEPMSVSALSKKRRRARRHRRVDQAEVVRAPAAAAADATQMNASTADGGRFDFEARRPWYSFLQDAEDPPGAVVSVLPRTWVNGTNRVVTARVDGQALPPWGQLALHLRLRKPPSADMKIDRWDRLGSVGLFLTEAQVPGMHLVPAPAKPPGRRQWAVSMPA